MSKSSKQQARALLILSCTSLLGSIVDVPLIKAEEVVKQSLTTEVPSEENVATFSFSSQTEETIQTKLLNLPIAETTLQGVSLPLSEIKVIFDDGTEIITQSDETGAFSLSNFVIGEGSQFAVVVTDQEGLVSETATFTVTLNTPEVAEPVAEAPISGVSGPKEEAPAAEPMPETDAVAETGGDVAGPVQRLQTFSTFAATAVPMDQVGTRYYYIKAKDTLYGIATKYGVRVADLLRWNNLADANLIKIGDIISINGTNDYENFNKENITFTSRTQFVDYIARYAKDIAPEYGLYPSVMIAQAAHETGYGTSGLSRKANNFFGIKADKDYPGYSIIMPTWEWVNGERVEIDAAFRLYPSFYDSLLDNARKLSGGVSWDPYYYQGTWVSNTNNFKDATLYLTGRYATDDRYYFGLNDTILTYNLTKYDRKPYADTSYTALVTKQNSPIGNVPLNHVPSNHAWYKEIVAKASSNDYFGAVVTVTHVTRDGQYANIYGYNQDNKYVELGWIHTAAITPTDSEIENVDYEAYFTSTKENINSLPLDRYGRTAAGNAVVGITGNYLNKKLKVASQTKDGLQSFVTIDGQALGWVRTSELGNSVSPYPVTVVNGAYHVNNVPWGSPGFIKIGDTSLHMGKELQVIAVSKSGYLLISSGGNTVGWVDSRSVGKFTYTNKNYRTYITSNKYEIDSLPWGDTGFKKLDNTAGYYGKIATVTKESANKAYLYVVIDGEDLGWIDVRAFGFKRAPYTAIIKDGKYEVDTLPWGTPGFTKVTYTSEYWGKKVEVIGATQDGSYLLAHVDGIEAGWIDSRSVVEKNVNSVDYSATVKNGTYQINDLPWGTPGFKYLGNTSSLVGKSVQVTLASADGSYVYVFSGDKAIGWIDRRAIN